jgi:hypothetical protein
VRPLFGGSSSHTTLSSDTELKTLISLLLVPCFLTQLSLYDSPTDLSHPLSFSGGRARVVYSLTLFSEAGYHCTHRERRGTFLHHYLRLFLPLFRRPAGGHTSSRHQNLIQPTSATHLCPRKEPRKNTEPKACRKTEWDFGESSPFTKSRRQLVLRGGRSIASFSIVGSQLQRAVGLNTVPPTSLSQFRRSRVSIVTLPQSLIILRPSLISKSFESFERRPRFLHIPTEQQALRFDFTNSADSAILAGRKPLPRNYKAPSHRVTTSEIPHTIGPLSSPP